MTTMKINFFHVDSCGVIVSTSWGWTKGFWFTPMKKIIRKKKKND
jgi:hypothetical protein